ncbi:MAG: RNA polymerase-binding protein RbpA [Pseudolysinimonas sp.]
MADRSLRGMRLGSQSLQSEEGVEFASRRKSMYLTEDGKTFDVVFSSDAEIPEVWSSPRTGQEGRLIGDDGTLVKTEEAEVKAPRTHWDMLLERRSRAELEELLQERLGLLRARRGQAAKAGSRKSA